MSMDSSGGLRKSVYVCRLKIQHKTFGMFRNFPDDRHIVKYVFQLNKLSPAYISIKILSQLRSSMNVY